MHKNCNITVKNNLKSFFRYAILQFKIPHFLSPTIHRIVGKKDWSAYIFIYKELQATLEPVAESLKTPGAVALVEASELHGCLD